ncbi:hypothetical protein NDU88_001707 [Pleurodeles waltl]|uniref:Integrase zinc-binding domain-containing protein n=1 Tax=Pleurodeles waltl TaxID=8319 RepID=A0AAV7UTH5_PLEWA|nr:hypothetical protein NDU88_001707 [Pleurodeles waltl]
MRDPKLQDVINRVKALEQSEKRIKTVQDTEKSTNLEFEHESGEGDKCDTVDMDFVAVVSDFISDEFKGIDEKKWVESDREDSVLQEVKEYVKNGWPGKEKVLEEFAPFFSMKDELEIENTLLFKRGKCVPPRSMQAVILDLAHEGHPGMSSMKRLIRMCMDG